MTNRFHKNPALNADAVRSEAEHQVAVAKLLKCKAFAKTILKEIRAGNRIDAIDAREFGATYLSNVLQSMPTPRCVGMFYPYGDKVEVDYKVR